MNTTYVEDVNFRDEVIGTELLENALEWISIHLNPEVVFEKSELEEWAINNGFVREDDTPATIENESGTRG